MFIIKPLRDNCAQPETGTQNNQNKIMSETNNVKFFEAEKGKWMYKKYDENGSVVFRSDLFDSEVEARAHYENAEGIPSTPAQSTEPAEQAPETQPETGTAEQTTAPAEGDISAENTSPEGEAGLV